MRNSLVIVASPLLAVCVWLTPVSVAWAGEWTQVTCTQPNGAPAPIEGWQGTSLGGYGPGSGPSDTCEQRGGALTAFDSSTAQEAAYTGPMWVYTAPAGSTIAGGALTVALNTPQGQAYVATPRNEYSQADVLINCQFNLPCATAARTVPIIHPGGTQLFMVAECVGPTEGATTCPAGSGGGVNAVISLHAADIELANSSTPTGMGFGGSLLEPGASGTADLIFSAHDPSGPGVYRVIVNLDGTAVYQGTPDGNGGRCASVGTDQSGVSEFLYAQPCKQDVAVDVPLDTTRYVNGAHRLKITVQDAAGNGAVVYSGTTFFANHAAAGTAVGPGSLLSVRGAANGTGASDQAGITARWTRTRKTTRASRYGMSNKIVGSLTAPGGQGIAGASIDVYVTPSYQGAPARQLGSVRTGPTGRWALGLPRDVSSSTLRFAYRSHLNDTVVVAECNLRLDVHAGITLKIAPHLSSVGHRIVLSGVLHGAPIPAGGKQLVLEARSGGGGEWIQFNTVRTNARGRFHASYRFKFPGPITYQFRVLSPPEADFPFLDGTSRSVAVHEL